MKIIKPIFNARRYGFYVFNFLCCFTITLSSSEINNSTLKSPEFSREKPNDGTKKLLIITIIIIASSATVLTILFLLGRTIFLRSRKRSSDQHSDDEEQLRNSPTNETQKPCRRFTLAEIRAATNDFDPGLKIGSGGSGRVYKGFIDDNKETPVAVKVIKSASSQGLREFWTEVKTVSKLRNPNLVSLIGYCDDQRSRIIVYEYMAHGTLRDGLYGAKKQDQPLDWERRLEIMLGAARGLAYLHAAAGQGIIHRDVKTSNILLDENLAAKVSDFGLSRLGPESPSKSHVSTEVRGTFGYLDPDYFLTKQLTAKSDVYGFGVVMFEVLCGRPAVDTSLDEAQQSLAQWARIHVKRGTLDQIVDADLTDRIGPECLELCGKIAHRCLRSDRHRRPKMADVLRGLEAAVRLQRGVGVAAEEGIIDIWEGDDVMSERCEKMCCWGGGNQVVERPLSSGDVVHSCPTIRDKSKDEGRVLLRFLSDNVGLRWATQPPFCALRTLWFTCSCSLKDSDDNCCV